MIRLSTLVFGLLCTTSLTGLGQEITKVPGAVGLAQFYGGSLHSGPGPALNLTFSPTSRAFGSQNVGTSSSPQAFVATNVGSGSFPFASIAMTGTNAGDFSQTNTCPGSLATGANCSINVTFTPTASGFRGATVLATATGGATFGAAVSGTGTAVSCSGGTFTTTQTNPAGTLTDACITTSTGPCVVYNDGASHTLAASQIGPCGDNNTNNASQGVYITSGTAVNIYDSYIHVERLASNCSTFDSHDGVEVFNNSTATVNVQGNVIAYGQANVRIFQSSNVTVQGNFLLNPRGNTTCTDPDNVGGDQVQSYCTLSIPCNSITVSDNYTISAPTGYLYPTNSSDQINFGFTHGITAANNWVDRAQYANACGITIDTGSLTASVTGNVISNTYNCGIGVATGTNHTISSNKIVITGGGINAGGIAIIGSFNSPAACNTIALTSNQSYAYQTAHNYVQGYYNDGYCTSVTLTSNTFDVGCTTGVDCVAYTALNPLASTNPPPLIPPVPKTCVAKSPYSTQTGTPCS